MISRAKEPESSTDVMLSLQIGLFVPVVDICDCIYFWLLMEKLKLLFKKAIFLLKAFFFCLSLAPWVPHYAPQAATLLDHLVHNTGSFTHSPVPPWIDRTGKYTISDVFQAQTGSYHMFPLVDILPVWVQNLKPERGKRGKTNRF